MILNARRNPSLGVINQKQSPHDSSCKLITSYISFHQLALHSALLFATATLYLVRLMLSGNPLSILPTLSLSLTVKNV